MYSRPFVLWADIPLLTHQLWRARDLGTSGERWPRCGGYRAPRPRATVRIFRVLKCLYNMLPLLTFVG